MESGSDSGASITQQSGADDGEGATVPFGTFRPTERRALIGCAFASMCMLLLPQELMGAGISLLVAIALFIWHRVRSKREAREAEALAAREALERAAADPPAPSSSPAASS